MASKATLNSRAMIAARFSALMRTPSFYAKARERMPLDSEGGYSVIVADPEESAVVTVHRMELLGEEKVSVVTVIDGAVSVTSFKATISEEPPSNAKDIPGGMTIREWLEVIESSRGTYTISGSEFAAELTSETLTSAS